MSNLEELTFLDATAQAELVRRKEIKPIELVEACIERIETLNPTLNAVITSMYDQAREAAKGKLPDGPFTGVPFLLKDILAAYKRIRLVQRIMCWLFKCCSAPHVWLLIFLSILMYP